MVEHWREIVEFPNYEVSDAGRVRSRRSGRMMALVPHLVRGTVHALCVRLWADGGSKFVRVHRLVLAAFVGEPAPSEVGCHWDGDPTNNRLSNLRWGSPTDNAADRVRHGTAIPPPIRLGEQHGLSKLTEEHVRAIRAAVPKAGEFSRVGRAYGVSGQAIKDVIERRVWRHV